MNEQRLGKMSLVRTIRGMALGLVSGLVLTGAGMAPVHADETCLSPYTAKITGQEDYVYVWTLGAIGVGDEQDKLVTVENIQKTVASYFKIRVSDLLSKRRSRSIARPRQIAMALAKELTTHSLPEIGDLFGGRDHTTVLHACRRVKELRETETRVAEDYNNLLRTLTS